MAKLKYLEIMISQKGRLVDEITERTEAGKLFGSIKNTFLGNNKNTKGKRTQIFRKLVVDIIIHWSESHIITESNSKKKKQLKLDSYDK